MADDGQKEEEFQVIFPDASVLNNALPSISNDLIQNNGSKSQERIIRIHKSNTFTEMINLFRDKIMDFDETVCRVVRVMPNGQDERSEGIGFIKDVFCEFWDTFYTKCCEGVDTKVPILRHDMGVDEWQSVGAIICNGYKTVSYFPVGICQAVIEDALGAPNNDLIKYFMTYIPQNDKDVIQTALNNFDEVDLGDLIDVLEGYNCRKYPSKENIKTIIEEISHKEILQKPKFVTDCWKVVFKDQLKLHGIAIGEIYEEMRPTVGKVLKALSFPDKLDLKEQLAAGHLKKFIKTLDSKGVQIFLRFCTGANLSCKKNNVEFTRLS